MLLVTRVSSFAKASGDKTHPPSRGARHPPPGIHPRKQGLRGARGRWAFIRPTRRITVILSILWRWALVTSYSQLVTRDRLPFAEASGDKSSFAKASGDKSPPPVARGATPPARNPPTQTGFARGPGAVGIGAFVLCSICPTMWAFGTDHPGTTTHEKLHFRGARYRATPPLDEELVVFSLRAEFPSVWKLYSAGAFYFWVKKSPGWGIIFLMTKIMTKAIRCPSSRISNWPDEPESYPVYFYRFDAPTMPAPIRL